jgi:hypothetical protein
MYRKEGRMNVVELLHPFLIENFYTGRKIEDSFITNGMNEGELHRYFVFRNVIDDFELKL